MGLVARKPVFGFLTKWDSNQPAQLQRLARKSKLRLWQVWIWYFPKKWKTKALIRLCGCAGWSTPLLFANLWRQVFSHRGPNILNQLIIIVVLARKVSLLLLIVVSKRAATRQHSSPESNFASILTYKMGPINWKNSKSIIMVSEVTDLAGDTTGKNFRPLSDLSKADKILWKKYQWTITPKICNELPFLHYECHLMMIYICVPSHKNISNCFFLLQN